MMSPRIVVCALLLAAAGAVSAQPAQRATAPASTQKLTPQQEQQRAAIQKINQALLKYSESIVVAIDQGKIGEVWDGASPVAHKAVNRADFIKAVKKQRDRVGTPKSRQVARITDVQSDGKRMPAGTYVNVNFATTFSKQAAPEIELVSFHLDSDNHWRLSGYALKPMPTRPAGSK